MIRVLMGVVLAVGAVTLGCGSGGGGLGPRGMQCSEVLTDFCNRAADPCQIIPENQVSACINSGISSCCAGDCGAAVVSTESEIQTCIADINAASCASLDITNGGTLPSTCIGVVQSDFVLGAGASRSMSLDPNDVASGPGAGIGQLISR